MGKSAAAIEYEIHEAVAQCNSLAAVGLWHKMQWIIKHNPHLGHLERDGLPLSLVDVCALMGRTATSEKALGLIGKLTKIRVGDEPLIQWTKDEILYSPPQFRADVERRRVADAVEKSRHAKTKNGDSKSETGLKALRNAKPALHERYIGVTSALPPAPPPSPAPLVSPHTPLPNPPPSSPSPPPLPAAAPPAGEAAPKKKRGTEPGSVSPLNSRCMARWEAKWSERHHGAEYSPGRVDWVKLAEILGKLKAKQEPERCESRFEKVIDTFLRQPEEFGYQGHKLSVMVQHWQFIISETVKAEKGIESNGAKHGNTKPPKPTAEQRGEFPEDLAVPIVGGRKRD